MLSSFLFNPTSVQSLHCNWLQSCIVFPITVEFFNTIKDDLFIREVFIHLIMSNLTNEKILAAFTPSVCWEICQLLKKNLSPSSWWRPIGSQLSVFCPSHRPHYKTTKVSKKTPANFLFIYIYIYPNFQFILWAFSLTIYI